MPSEMVERCARAAERCEKATGPDRVVDCLIYMAVNGIPDACGKRLVEEDESPAYTASLDAAMTLVPEGGSVNLYTPGAYPGQPGARLKHPDHNPFGEGEPRRGGAATPALALCAAALRARAAEIARLNITEGD